MIPFHAHNKICMPHVDLIVINSQPCVSHVAIFKRHNLLFLPLSCITHEPFAFLFI